MVQITDVRETDESGAAAEVVAGVRAGIVAVEGEHPAAGADVPVAPAKGKALTVGIKPEEVVAGEVCGGVEAELDQLVRYVDLIAVQIREAGAVPVGVLSGDLRD